MKISFDYETYSAVDLKKHGVWRYATHPSTEVVCTGYAIEGEMQPIWLPHQPTPQVFREADKHEWYAWNAMFEYLITKYVLKFDTGPLSNWHCTMAKAQSMALPGHLGACAKVMGLEEQKDARGKYLINKLSKPFKGVRNRDPALLAEFYSYCLQDVRTEMAIDNMLPAMTEDERRIWLLTQKINNTGIPMDIASCQNALALYDRTKQDLDVDLFGLTFLANPNSNQQMRGWLAENDCPMDSLSADAIKQVLEE